MRLLPCALLSLAAAAGACAAPPAADAPVTICLVRHAEKAADDPKDPDLSDAGRARAQALATLLEHAGVTRLFASEYKRTQQTLQPLSEKCGHAIEVVPAGTIDAQAALLKSLPAGSVAVVAGHSDTIPKLARALGLVIDDVVASPAGEVLPDYGRLLVVILPPPDAPSRQPLRAFRLQFGDGWHAPPK